MHQAGFLDYAVRKSKHITNQCSLKEKSNNERAGQGEEVVALTLRDFEGAFLILGAGFSLAFFILACECIWKIISRERPYALY